MSKTDVEKEGRKRMSKTNVKKGMAIIVSAIQSSPFRWERGRFRRRLHDTRQTRSNLYYCYIYLVVDA